MPTRPDVLLAHQRSQLQYESELLGQDSALQTPLTTFRQHLDPNALPRPEYFTSLDELHTWYEIRFGDASNDHLELCSKHRQQPSSRRKAGSKSTGFSSEDSRPGLTVCHDFQGGYKERSDGRGYTFEHFHLANTFIYFSHHRVSIPPAGWIHAADRAGTKVLGTVIFEWKESIPDLSNLLRGPSRKAVGIRGPPTFSPQYAVELIELALERGFSGYLINIEVSLDLGFACSGEMWPAWVGEQARHVEMSKNAERLRAWVCFLRDEGRKRFTAANLDSETWEIMWYDSVTYPNGQLAWQDALTPNNTAFLQAADTFFTNYTWARPPQPLPPGTFVDAESRDPQILHSRGFGLTGPDDGGHHPALLMSATMIDRLEAYTRDMVYVGIDVFGRNCWGGMETWKSLNMIGPHKFAGSGSISVAELLPSSSAKPLGLSVALFAPGWTWEHDEPCASGRSWNQWWQEDCSFWLTRRSHDCVPIQQYFSHVATDKFRVQRKSRTDWTGFYTNFAVGSGTSWFVSGHKVCDWSSSSSATDATLSGWTDQGAWLPKPDLLYAFMVHGDTTDKLSAVECWRLDEETVFDGNVSLALTLRPDCLSQNTMLCSVPVSARQWQSTDWVLRVAFKASTNAKIDLQPIATCDHADLTESNCEIEPMCHGWCLASTVLNIGEILQPSRSIVLSLGIKIPRVEGLTTVNIGALALEPLVADVRTVALPMHIVPGPERRTLTSQPLISATLQWPNLGLYTPYCNVWIQRASNASSRQWLGTSTREATTNEFCILGLDVTTLLPNAQNIEFVATPLALTDRPYAAGTMII